MSKGGVKSHAGEEWPEKDRVSWRRVSANNDKDGNGGTCLVAKMKTETDERERERERLETENRTLFPGGQTRDS